MACSFVKGFAAGNNLKNRLAERSADLWSAFDCAACSWVSVCGGLATGGSGEKAATIQSP
jgi:hypothetical protein